MSSPGKGPFKVGLHSWQVCVFLKEYLKDRKGSWRDFLQMKCRIRFQELTVSSLKDKERNSALLKCGLHSMTSFQRAQYGSGQGVTLQWRDLTDTTSARWPRSASAVITQVDSVHLDVRWWKWHLASTVILSKTNDPSLITRKTSDTPKLKEIL